MEGLTTGGILFMIIAYSVIIGLATFCFSKVLKNNKTKSE